MKPFKIRLLLVMQFLTLLMIIGLIAYAIYFFANRQHIPESLEKVQDQVKTLELNYSKTKDIIEDFNNRIENNEYKISDIEINKPKDGRDGLDGNDGIDSNSTHIIEKETIVKEVPVNGRDGYIDIRCNESKNRWEVRYSENDIFKVLNGNPVKCQVI